MCLPLAFNSWLSIPLLAAMAEVEQGRGHEQRRQIRRMFRRENAGLQRREEMHLDNEVGLSLQGCGEIPHQEIRNGDN